MDIEIFQNIDQDIVFSNVYKNSRRNIPWIKQLPEHSGHAVIVGGGYSIKNNIESIKWRKSLGQKIFALNNAAKFLSDNGIEVDYQVIVDAREFNKRFIGYANNYLLASQCDPAVFDETNNTNVSLWHHVEPVIEDLTKHLPEYEDEYVLIGGGTTVGLSAMCLVYALGYRKLHLYGYDSSHFEKNGHAYEQKENDTMPLCKVTINGKVFTSSLAMALQAELFPECCNNLIDLGCIITVDGDGLIMEVMKYMASHPVNESLTEKQKYEEMWSHPEYRHFSPGEYVVKVFLEQEHGRGTLLDFGCGSGREAVILKKAGFSPVLLDIAHNCRDNDSDVTSLPFYECDFSEEIIHTAQYGYCSDVMEHIPQKQIDIVISNIMKCVDKCFFQISLIEDGCGKLIGHKLHQSVYPYKWWFDKFTSLGFYVFWAEDNKTSGFYYITKLNRNFLI